MTFDEKYELDTHIATPQSLGRSGRNENKGEQLPYLDSPWGIQAYAIALDQLGIVSIADTAGRIIHVNEEFVRISGYARDELLAQNHRLLNSGHHPEKFFRDMYRTIANGKPWRAPIRNRRKDGSNYWVDALIVPLKNANGKIIAYLSIRIDITKEVGLHITLQERTALLQGVVESFPGGLSIYDKDMRLILCNQNQKQMLDYPDELFADGAPSFETIVRFNAERGEYGHGDVDAFVAKRLDLASKAEPHIFERQRPNGAHIEIRGMPLDGGGFVTTYLDISQRKADQETINHLAHHDPLTGLPNRLLFHDRIRQGIARVKRGDTLALLCIDLDRFKSVNDTLGHPVGDELLKIAAKRLSNCVRETDTVARLGGDEFSVIQVAPKSAADVAKIAARIIDAIAAPFKIGENTVNIGASIGIAMAPADGDHVDQLMQNADLALYRVKSEGRGHYGFFEASMQTRLMEQSQLAIELRQALETGDFELHYQPIVNIQRRRVSGCEALVRWKHPTRGFISASEFIPAAEEAGLIGKIDDWVLATACKAAANWPEGTFISVNVSAAQLRSLNFADKVKDSLRGLPPSRLILEITESMLMQDRELAAAIMQNLRQIGVRFALDDFGTGYSSLSYLQNLPFDKLKIDRSFMSTAADQRRTATLRRAIVQLGQNLGMTTIAEGVETADQLNCLREEGCPEAQGYHFAKPAPASVVEQMFGKKL